MNTSERILIYILLVILTLGAILLMAENNKLRAELIRVEQQSLQRDSQFLDILELLINAPKKPAAKIEDEVY